MQIADLSYLENAPENELILGSASATITADASAGDPNSLTYTGTDLDLRTNKKGVARLKGIGAAVAIGEDPTADVSYTLEGFDKTKVETFDKQGSNYDLEIVKIKAIDRPNK
ncbi:MAG: hypothetical protein N2235_21555 [Fischerella sp.]|nr:hypothetical protein [Fischerella sp.]